MDFFAVVDSQRAIRRFRPDPVGLHDLRRVLEAATRAPSARGAEPWVFVVVRDPGLRAEIARRYRVAWDEGQRCRVIGVTAYPESLLNGRVAGCDACLQVPAPISQVVSTVARCAEGAD